MQKISVLLVDDHAVVRAGLRALIEAAGDMKVAGEAENGRRAVVMARQTRPDVVLMDIAMPHLNGYEATRRILRHHASTRVLVLTSFGGDENVRQMLDAGAAGFVMKHSAATELLRAIREVYQGKHFYSPTIGRRVTQLLLAPRQSSAHPLSSREKEVLQLVAEGCSNKEIASQMSISIKTVEKHRQQTMDKLQIHDTAGLTRYAILNSIVDPTGSTDPDQA